MTHEHKPHNQHKAPVAPKVPNWDKIQAAVNSNNKLEIKALGEAYGKAKKVQEGVTAEEVREQILQMAPGDNPLVGPLLLDLSDKL